MYGVLSYVTRGHSFIYFSICDQSVIHLVLYDEIGAEIAKELLMLSGRVSLFGNSLPEGSGPKTPRRTLFLGGVP
jgi:hypothetical protein